MSAAAGEAGVRLQRVLAEAGLGSRRFCEELISSGRVRVDGEVAELGRRVQVEREIVTLDGRTVTREPREYWLLNKPADVITTVTDTHNRVTVRELVPSSVRVYPVGRLDKDTTGVLLLTNDGVLAHALTHPRHEVVKEYRAVVEGPVAREALDALRRGVELEDGLTFPAEVECESESSGTSVVVLRIHEGRKRQVRRMLEAVGRRVIALHRSRFGPISDAGLRPSEARRLKPAEIEALRQASGVSGCTGGREAL